MDDSTNSNFTIEWSLFSQLYPFFSRTTVSSVEPKSIGTLAILQRIGPTPHCKRPHGAGPALIDAFREGQKQITCTSNPTGRSPHPCRRPVGVRENLREIRGSASRQATSVPLSVRHGQAARARQGAAAPERLWPPLPSASGLCPWTSEAAELGHARSCRSMSFARCSVGWTAGAARRGRRAFPVLPHSEKDLGCAHEVMMQT